ncbi:50S ribosomal protein L25/general stress protein Ctc [Massilia eurypsychrophila]|uniref:Large ribosomal subunit protein bL25 n=1 Tax=Massilia eurypsychrophila TaxID=1485217 RepID=A0A2G8TDR6_9BURK|nr:50S ribosomal protein L25/general stress protein Ctc [Massilia eurypsychrophila]PIL44109.1 50S ribosomal protein L25/general stress protein Ctc [Massilia eurypsychrophila]
MKVIAFNRTLQGSGASRRLRTSGQTPGIIYGGTEAPVMISLDGNALYHALKKEAFHGSVLDLEIDGATQAVMLRDFQMHAYKQLVMHADFQRVDAKSKVHTKVTLHFVNADVSPAVKLHGAIVSHVLAELEITCLPGDLPEFIEVDLANIDVGHSIHVADLTMPKGVTAITHGSNLTVATAAVPAGHVAADALESAAAAAASEADAAAKGAAKPKK